MEIYILQIIEDKNENDKDFAYDNKCIGIVVKNRNTFKLKIPERINVIQMKSSIQILNT